MENSRINICVLGWGSLIWNEGHLCLGGNFQNNGPALKLEFSRLSSDGRLTLVIDEIQGETCMTFHAVSAFKDLDSAIGNLWIRENKEGAVLPFDLRKQKTVGFYDLTSGISSEIAAERHPHAVETIKAWVSANGYDAVVWTALGSNFHEPKKANESFSVEAAIRYLESLEKLKLEKALHYIRKAPQEVQTPVRAAVNLGWPER